MGVGAYDDCRTIEPAAQSTRSAWGRDEGWLRVGIARARHQADLSEARIHAGADEPSVLRRQSGQSRRARGHVRDRVSPQQEAAGQVLPFGLLADAIDALAVDLGWDAVSAHGHRRNARTRRYVDEPKAKERNDCQHGDRPHRQRLPPNPALAVWPLCGVRLLCQRTRIVWLVAIQLQRPLRRPR